MLAENSVWWYVAVVPDAYVPTRTRNDCVSSRKPIRLLAWILLAAAVALTVVPPQFRRVTGAPSWLEHFAMFFITGSAFTLGYPRSEYPLSAATIASTACLELLQLCVPGRHARISDFVIDALSALVGIAISSLLTRNKLMRLKY